MNASIIWLARLAIDQGLFGVKDAWSARIKLGEDVDLVDFAQHLVDVGVVRDAKIDILENIAGLALAKAADGPPHDDPFASAATHTDSPFSAPPSPAKPTASSPGLTLASRSTRSPEVPAGAIPSSPQASPESAAVSQAHSGGIGDFPFDRISSLSDGDLAVAMRGLLKACAREGISDLHLSAGARPFVRRERTLEHLAAKALGAEESLRLNTALLAPHQRELFL
ncbi:MAG: hypothetical protein H7067_01400, partial [Burkholderiales bacterium]|nr:hypothetical protein [Opitutaceae bacterium]